MEEEIPTCAICGDPEQDKYMVTLTCNHSFHYECIMKSFQYSYKKDRCNKCSEITSPRHFFCIKIIIINNAR